jgi:deazaflavin-dependent oxidoreductase (nitroreductase family)
LSADDFFSRLNPLITGLLRTPVLHWLLSPGILLITVTGRRSGRRYTIPVGYRLQGDDVTVMVSEARKKQWWRNYREPAAVELRLRGRARRGTAEVVAPASPEFRRRAEWLLRRVPGLPGVFGIELDRRSGLSDAQVTHLGREAAVVRIELESR